MKTINILVVVLLVFFTTMFFSVLFNTNNVSYGSMDELRKMMCELNIKAGTPELNIDDPNCAGLGYINMTIINQMFGK